MTELADDLIGYFADQNQKMWAMGVSDKVSYVIQESSPSPEDAGLKIQTNQGTQTIQATQTSFSVTKSARQLDIIVESTF